MFSVLLIAATLFSTQQGGVSFAVESETKVIDPAQSVFVKLVVTAPHDARVALPDLRERVKGFSLAEDFAEEPLTQKDGSKQLVVNWRLLPEPCAKEYRIRPFAVTVNEGRNSFVAGPIDFEPPSPREAVTGGMEIDPQKDMPPLSWKLVGWVSAALLAALIVLAMLFLLVKYLARRIKEHRMSPIERAWVELDRLLKKGLPGRGRYKDFYVELTMVVRRYVQRRYDVRAPHLTTEEFLKEFSARGLGSPEDLRRFLESADMVKFAGVEATPDMADDATESARGYLKGDDKSGGVAK